MNDKVWSRFACNAAVVAIACFLAAGCESHPPVALQPVSGKVLLASGKPLTSGTVCFEGVDAPAVVAKGKLKEDGSFVLTTKKEGDGAAIGKNRVYIEPDPETITKKGAKVIYPFPPQYMDEESSPLLVEVKLGTNELEPIKLEARIESSRNVRD